jgi:type 1 glutamine amidotransferase
MKKVLLITDGFLHPPYLGRMALHKALGKLKEFEFKHVSSLERLPHTHDHFSALVIYLHHKKVSARALAALEAFVSNGGGLLAIHSATASFKETIPYFEILGGRFTGHGAVENFEIKREKTEIFAGIKDFVVKDELYLHEIQPGIDVHFTTTHEGQNVPVVWTYRHGKGKVCYAVPGHTARSMRNPLYQEILRVGLLWVTG